MKPLQALPAGLAASLDADARSFGLPGMAIAVVTPEQRAFHLFGVEAAGTDRPVTRETWFSLASVAKHATALATLTLAQDGLIDVASPIGRYLRDLPPGWGRRSVASLMRHTSGLPEYLGGTEEDEAVPERRSEFIERYGSLPPVFEEGEGWIYSNTNYILLAFLVAQMRGTSLAGAMQRIVDRLAAGNGIAVASPQWTRAANLARLGPSARDEASQRREVIGDGDLSLTVEGAATWLEGLLGGVVLGEPWRSVMGAPSPLATGRPAPYGCGWFVDRLGDEPICHHAGHFDGWTAMAYLAPARRAGAIAMCNLAPRNTRAMRFLAQKALEAMSPGSTPLSLAPIGDDAPLLTATARSQLLRDGDALDTRCFADELLRVAARGGQVRSVVNLWSGQAPERFELVEQQLAATHRFRRYRLAYADRTEHLLVGTTPEDTIFWAWPL